MADSSPYNSVLSQPPRRLFQQTRYPAEVASALDARLDAPVQAPPEGHSDLERFRVALLRGIGARPLCGCWEWARGTAASNYGLISFGAAGRHYAHRAAWFIAHGALPLGQPFVLHDCDNTLCVRPSHLYAGTPADNGRDMSERGRVRNRVIPRRVSDAARAELRAGGTKAEIAQRLIDTFGVTRSAAYWHLSPAVLRAYACSR